MTAAWEVADAEAGVWSAARVEHGVRNVRTAVVRLRDGGLLVVSPYKDMPVDLQDGLTRLGEVRWILAPNHFHNLGIDACVARFAHARVVASAIARRRLPAHVAAPILPLEAMVAELPDHVSLLEPPGTRNGEVIVRVVTGAGVLWIVADAFFHLPVAPTGAPGLFVRAVDLGPGLRVGCTFKWIALADRALYGRWIRQALAADRPTVLVPGHGDVLRGADLTDRLRAQVDRKLPG